MPPKHEPTNPYSMITEALAQFKTNGSKLTALLLVCGTMLIGGIAALLYYGPVIAKIEKNGLRIDSIILRLDKIENALHGRGILLNNTKETADIVYDDSL